jgi:hypothetical protein
MTGQKCYGTQVALLMYTKVHAIPQPLQKIQCLIHQNRSLEGPEIFEDGASKENPLELF